MGSTVQGLGPLTKTVILAAAAACTAKVAVAIAITIANPGCLAGTSSHGLPWVVPAVFSVALMTMGWWIWSSSSVLWRLVSIVLMLGSSMFARTPLHKAAGIRVDWEPLPLLAVATLLGIRALYATRSKVPRYRILGYGILASVATAVFIPWASYVVQRWPTVVIIAGYGSLGLTMMMIAYTFHKDETHELA